MDIERRLGSTEIAAVAALYLPELALELPKNKTACDVFNRLRYALQQPKKKTMDRGNREEPTALNYYRKHVGPYWRARPHGYFWTVRHPQHEWFTASPDAWDCPRPRIVIEAKTWSEAWGRKQWGTPGTDQMATRYQYQCQWLMSCCDAERTVVVVMFGNDIEGPHGGEVFDVTEPALFHVERDDKTERFLLECGERFISEFVRPGIPPPVKPHNNRREMKKRLANERGEHAVDEWESRCIAYAAELGTQAGGGDGRGGQGAEEWAQ
jgi:hypothetical protein